jgi:hypothetical protein
MPVPIPIPIPFPRPIPWPAPGPGIGVPTPSPAPSPAPSPGGSVTPGVSPISGITEPFAKLFKFIPDWGLLLALFLVALSVDLVDQTYPEYVWMYVGILLLGIILVSEGFTPQLNRWIGR